MTRVALLILAALGLGVFAGVGTFYVQEASTEQALSKYEKVLVLFAIEDIPKGTSLFEATTLKLVEYQLFPEEFLPDTVMLERGDSDNSSIATDFIPSGTLVLEGDFQPPTQAQPQSIVPANFAAVSLYLTGQQRGAGLVTAGSNVGVLATEFDAESDAERTTVLFDSIQVLAVDGDTESTGLLAGDQRQKEAIVTLAVPEGSVASLLSSYSNGDITLVLLEDGEKLPMVQKG